MLVDDGGTDDLAGWVRDRAEPRVRLIRQDNAGPSAARNTGIAASDGELVAFLDSDDTWEPDYLSRMVGCFDDPAVGLAYSGWDVVDAEGIAGSRDGSASRDGEGGKATSALPPLASRAARAVALDG